MEGLFAQKEQDDLLQQKKEAERERVRAETISSGVGVVASAMQAIFQNMAEDRRMEREIREQQRREDMLQREEKERQREDREQQLREERERQRKREDEDRDNRRRETQAFQLTLLKLFSQQNKKSGGKDDD